MTSIHLDDTTLVKSYRKSIPTEPKEWEFDSGIIPPGDGRSLNTRLRGRFKQLTQFLEERRHSLRDWHPSMIDLLDALKVVDRREQVGVAPYQKDAYVIDVDGCRGIDLYFMYQGKNYRLTPLAIDQLSKILGVSQTHIRRLLQANDEDDQNLLETIYRREFRQRRSRRLLVRLEDGSNKDPSAPGIVRAILPSSDKVMENLYVVRAFREVMGRHPDLFNGYVRLLSDGDHFRIEVSRDRFSNRTRESKALSDFAIRNCEIQSNALYFELARLRHVGTSGKETRRFVRLELPPKTCRLLAEQYREPLPPAELPDHLQALINTAVEAALELRVRGSSRVSELGDETPTRSSEISREHVDWDHAKRRGMSPDNEFASHVSRRA